MRWQELDKEQCSIARALSVVGDRWTLMVLRECFLGCRRFDDFEERLGITRHLLADRLKKLTASGVLVRVAYQDAPPRYEYRLTQKGLDLYPILMALVAWGDKYMAGRSGPPVVYEHKPCGHLMHAVPTCSECGEALDVREVRVLDRARRPLRARRKAPSKDSVRQTKG